MPQSCCASGCTNRRTKGTNLQFFTFPFKRPEILEKWITAIGRINFKPSKYSTICSEHFTRDAYVNHPNLNRPYLRTDAVPSVFKPAQKKRKRKVIGDEMIFFSENEPETFETPEKCPDKISNAVQLELSKQLPTETVKDESLTKISVQKDKTLNAVKFEVIGDKMIFFSENEPETRVPDKISNAVQLEFSKQLPRKRVKDENPTNILLRKKIKVLNQNIRRKNKKINTLKQLLRTLANNRLCLKCSEKLVI